MELALQAKLLRVLQEREVDRVGGKDPVSIDVRVVATTNRNLEDYVREGKFRADLFYRLNVIPLTLPPLRERKVDIKVLTEYFMRQFMGENAPKLSEGVVDALLRYSWPGNIRELQNAVQRAAILSRGSAPRESDFLLSMDSGSVSETPRRLEVSDEVSRSTPTRLHDSVERIVESAAPNGDGLIIRSGTTVQDMERALILETLRVKNNNRTEAAKLLGISIRTLRNKLNDYRQEGIVIDD
jgi:DNA-binding NtrC family response regulator